MKTQEYDNQAVGRRIASGMADRGMSREDLAEAVGVSKYVVGEWVRGRTAISLESAVKICDVFDWPLDRIAVREEN